MSWLIRFVLNILAILGLGFVFGPGFPIQNPVPAVGFIIILTVLNWTLRPILKLFTLPLNILTLGLLGFLINGFIVVLAGYLLGINIQFIPGLVAAVVLGFVNGAGENFNA